MASHLDNPPLVKGQGAEAAAPKAAPVAGEAELDLPQGRDSPLPVVGRVPGPHVGQIVDVVHLLSGQGSRRGILHHVALVSVILRQHFPLEEICILILDKKAFGVGPLISLNLREGRQQRRLIQPFQGTAPVHGSRDVGDILHCQARVQGVGNLHHRALAHAVGNHIRPGIQQNAAAHLIVPVIIVPKPAQAGLNTAQNHRHILIDPADEIAVDNHRPIRPQAHAPSGGVGVCGAVLFGHRVVIYHGIHIS